MKHKDYKKLMKTSFDKLSEQDKIKRKKEFHRRLEVAQMFLNGITKGYVNNDIEIKYQAYLKEYKGEIK